MVLMPVMPIMSKNQVRRDLFLELFKIFLDLCSIERKEAIPELLDDDLPVVRLPQEETCTCACLPLPVIPGTEDDPGYFYI